MCSYIMAEQSMPSKEREKGQVKGHFWCSLCKINCPSADHLSQHLGGKKHKKRLEKEFFDLAKQNPTDHKAFPQNVLTNVQIDEKYQQKNEKALAASNMICIEGKQSIGEVSVNVPVSQKEHKESDNKLANLPLCVDEHDNGEVLENVRESINGEERKDNEEFNDRKIGGDKESMVENNKKRVHEENRDIAFKRHRKNGEPSSDSNLDKVEKSDVLAEKCELCNILCTSKVALETHVNGRKHTYRMKVAMMDEVEKNSGISEKCELCNIFCTSKAILQTHFIGRKHKNCLRRLEDGKAATSEVGEHFTTMLDSNTPATGSSDSAKQC